MKKLIKISDQLSAGGQPTEEDLKQLAEAGFVAVVNLRTEHEANQPPLGSEREQAKTAGLDYHHLPVSVGNLDAGQVVQFRKIIKEIPGPVYVHCGAGQRACAFSLLAKHEDKQPETLFQEAKQKGIEFPDEPVRAFITDCLSRK